MIQALKTALIELLSSKRGLVYVTSALVVVGNMFAGVVGYEVDKTSLAEFLAMSASWLISQGVADHGSTAAKINAAAAVSS